MLGTRPFSHPESLLTYLGLIRRHGAMVAFGILHAASSGFGQTYFISLFVPALLSAFGMSRSGFGSLYGAATLVSSLLLPVLGRGLDVWPVRHYAAAVTVGLALGCAAFAGAFNLPTLFIALLIVRHAGQGLMGHVAGTTVARHFHESRGSALSLALTGYPLAETFLPLIATVAIHRLGYRVTLLACAAALAVLVLPLGQWLFAVRSEPEDDGASSPSARKAVRSWTRAELLATPATWGLFPLYNAHAFLLTGLFFHQLALAEAKGLGATVLATSFVAFGISRGASSFLVGPLIDRFGPGVVLSLCLVPLAAGLCVLLAPPQPFVFAVYLTGAGLSMGSSGAARTAYLAERFGLGHLGAIKSMFGMLAVLSSAAAPPLFGLWLDQGGSVASLLVACLGYCAVSAVLGVWSFRWFARGGVGERS